MQAGRDSDFSRRDLLSLIGTVGAGNWSASSFQRIFRICSRMNSSKLCANAGERADSSGSGKGTITIDAPRCYRVEGGLLKASVGAPNGSERILGILGPGSVVGELSMIDGAPRSASVTTLRDSKLYFVSQADFDAIGKSSPEIYRDVMKMLA